MNHSASQPQVDTRHGALAYAEAVPSILPALFRDSDPTWLLVEEGFTLAREHEVESLFAIANGYVGNRGCLAEGSARGDPVVDFPEGVSGEDKAMELLRSVVESLEKRNGQAPPLSGLKDHIRKRDTSFTEKRFGYGGFRQFALAARAKGIVEMEWDEAADDYVVKPAAAPVS